MDEETAQQVIKELLRRKEERQRLRDRFYSLYVKHIDPHWRVIYNEVAESIGLNISSQHDARLMKKFLQEEGLIHIRVKGKHYVRCLRKLCGEP
jgi:hypothetical protein